MGEVPNLLSFAPSLSSNSKPNFRSMASGGRNGVDAGSPATILDRGGNPTKGSLTTCAAVMGQGKVPEPPGQPKRSHAPDHSDQCHRQIESMNELPRRNRGEEAQRKHKGQEPLQTR